MRESKVSEVLPGALPEVNNFELASDEVGAGRLPSTRPGQETKTVEGEGVVISPQRSLEHSSPYEALPSGTDLLRNSRPRRVLLGMASTSGSDRQEATDSRSSAEFEPQDVPPPTDAGAGGAKPPIKRPPLEGADVPEEPEGGGAGRATEIRESEGIESPEPTPRPVEIRHGERHDVVVNRKHPDSALAEYAADELRDGVPPSWPLRQQTYRSDIRVDSVRNPRLFVKSPHSVDADGFEQKYITPAEQASHSVLAQMAMAREVNDIVSRDEGVRHALESFGIALDVPQPVAGMSNRETGQKTVVYAWQEGVSAADPRAYAAHTMVEWVAEEVDRALRENRIVPVDHSVRQYLIHATDEGMGLSLTDVEMFHKLAPSERMYIPRQPMLESGEVEDFGDYIEYEGNEPPVEGSDQLKEVRVGPDGMRAARRNETNVDKSPVLSAQLHDGCAAVVWNPHTGEGGVAHFSGRAMEVADRNFRRLDELTGTLPTLGEEDCMAWTVGARAESASTWFGRDELATTLAELGIYEPETIPLEGVHHIELDVGTGVLTPYDADGNPLDTL